MATKKTATSNVSIRQAAVLARAGKPVPRDKALGKVTNAAKAVLRAGGSQTKPRDVTVGGKKMRTKPTEAGIGLGAAGLKAATAFAKAGSKASIKSGGKASPARWSSSSGRSGGAAPKPSSTSASKPAESAAKAEKATPKQSTRADRKGPPLTAAQKKKIGIGAAGTVAGGLAISKINKRKY